MRHSNLSLSTYKNTETLDHWNNFFCHQFHLFYFLLHWKHEDKLLYSQLDFKNEEIQFLVLTEWLKKPVEIVNYNESVLSKLNWYNAGVFAFTVLPFITGPLGLYGSYISFRILTFSDTYTTPVKFTIRTEKGADTIAPKLSNMMYENDLHVDNKLLKYDFVLKNRGYSEENFIAMTLQLKQRILKVIFKFIIDDEMEIAKNMRN